MTYREIKNKMIASITETLETYVAELSMEELVDEETISEFLWEMDFGRSIAEDYVNEHSQELVQDFLLGIYNEISTDDLDSPF